jgi:HEAT repeat protein
VILADALGEALGDTERSVRRAASDALVAIGGLAGGVDGVLRRALRGDDPNARWAAAFARARLAPPDPSLLPPIVEALACADGDVRWAAARLLVDIARLHPEVGEVALGLSRAGEAPVVRRMALFCLRELAPDDPRTAQALLSASHDTEETLRRAALSAMAGLLEPPPELLQRLVDALRGDSDSACASLAAVALGEIEARTPGALGSGELAALRSAADHADAGVRRAAARARARLDL